MSEFYAGQNEMEATFRAELLKSLAPCTCLNDFVESLDVIWLRRVPKTVQRGDLLEKT